MFLKSTIIFILFSLSPLLLASGSSDISPFKNGERVLFLGDSITRAGGWHSKIALFYETRYPDRNIVWLNAGISGDTSGGALSRIDWDVLDRNPSTVVIMLGMNDAAREDLPTEIGSETRVADYRQNMREIIQKLTRAKVQIILCTPSPYDASALLEKDGIPAANEALTRMADICRELATEFKVGLVDFNAPMNAIAEQYQRNNPSFTLIGKDRIHPGTLGNTLMSHLFLQSQGVSGLVSSVHIDLEGEESLKLENAKLHELVIEGNNISFKLKAKSLPMPFDINSSQALRLSPENELLKAMETMERPADVHTRFVEKEGETLTKAQRTAWDDIYWQKHLHQEIIKISGLAHGEYELLIDGKVVASFFDSELRDGVNLSLLRKTPQYQQALKLANEQEQRHRQASLNPRMAAFTRNFVLEPKGLNDSDPKGVNDFLKAFIADESTKDSKNLAEGSYAKSMAKKYLDHMRDPSKVVSMIQASNDKIADLKKLQQHSYRIQPVTHPIPQESRKAHFSERRSEEKLTALAEDFFDLMLLDKDELRRSGLRLRPEIQEINKLKKENKLSEALELYRDYFFKKLRNLEAYGIPTEFLEVRSKWLQPKGRDKTMERANELMEGKIKDHQAAMEPGEVLLQITMDPPVGALNPWSPNTFEPLVLAYLYTGEDRYLNRWIDYLDCWALFENRDDQIEATNISDMDCKGPNMMMRYLQALRAVANMQAWNNSKFPADSLARVLNKMMRIYIPLAIVYHDSNPQNWTPFSSARHMCFAAMFDEFKVAEYWFHRGRHRHENYGTIQNLPDGSETEHALWYNAHYFDGAHFALNLVEARRSSPFKHKVFWEQDVLNGNWEFIQSEKLVERANYFLEMLTPQSSYPIGNRSDQRRLPDWKSQALFDYAYFNGNSHTRTLIDYYKEHLESLAPESTMYDLPYSGSYLMRRSWNPDAGYAHFFSSPYPVGGHAFRGLKSNNSFWVSEAGQDILVTGGFGAYSYDRSPLTVDGKEQFSLAGLGNPGRNKNHKGFAVSYIDPKPANWRSHSSDFFDFAEGIYNGPYGDFVDDHHDNKDYQVGFLAERAREVITGVTHHRQVFHIKDARVWVLVDHLKSEQPRTYSLDWYLPAPIEEMLKTHRRYKGKTFAANTVNLNTSGMGLTTQAADMPNVHIHHFGADLKAVKTLEQAKNLIDDYTYKYKMYDFWKISNSFQGTGEDRVITLIEVIPEGGSTKIGDLESHKNGFKAELAGFGLLQFHADHSGSAELQLEDQKLVIGDESYEQNQNEKIKIHRPVLQVEISPARAQLVAGEKITMTCASNEVEIRYTLDGSEPTIHSTLYVEPFTLNGKNRVKARAFRKGLTEQKNRFSYTQASVTTSAEYKIADLISAVGNGGNPAYEAGLQSEYREGDWKVLSFYPEKIKPKSTRKVRWLFDRCSPQVDKAFSWTYHGFIQVPEDGVYTFHAPNEMITSGQEAGYNLRLFVGRELIGNKSSGRLNEWYPNTQRHAYGTWSIGLKKGLHPIKLEYVDYRKNAVEVWNHPGMKVNTIWDGKTPEILVSGSSLEKQAIPKNWFFRKK